MEIFTRFAMFCCLISLGVCLPYRTESIVPYSVVQFGNMIGCTTGLGQTRALLDYNGYGCYCGLGGSGKALDETDQCCVEHDSCYDKVMTSGACYAAGQVYAIIYEYQDQCKIPPTTITCQKHTDYTDHKWPECAEMMCECDRQGAICFNNERASFNKDFIRYDGTCE